jgi:UDP-glucose 4-epimerase
MPDISNSTILVTGGSGLIGSHTVELLMKEDVKKIIVFDKKINKKNLENVIKSNKVEIFQGDTSNPRDLREAAEGVNFVFHFAAMLLRPSARDPRDSLKDNIIGMYDLLETLSRQKVKKLIYSSSISVYGSSLKKMKMKEDHPFNNRTMYGAGKIVGEQFLRVFHETLGLDYLSLRYSCVYGPRQHHEHLYPGMMLEALDRIKRGLSPQIKGRGEETQDLIYVGDVAEANILALKSNVKDEMINIAYGKSISVTELIQILIGLTNPKLKIEFLPGSRPNLVPFRWISIEKAKKLLGFKPKVDIVTGLRRLIDWKKAL